MTGQDRTAHTGAAARVARTVAGWGSAPRSLAMSTSQSTLPATEPIPRRHRRWPVVLVIVLVLVAAIVIASSIISVPYYSLVPGDAQPVSQLITVPPAGTTP